MADATRPNITPILLEWSAGDEEASARLMPFVYDELRELAARHLRMERPDHTLQATALVHEAYLRLVDENSVSLRNRAQFFGLAAQIMRRILVDHARRHRAEKRGGASAQKLSLDEVREVSSGRSVDLIALDDALKDLAKFDERQSRIVELRFFGGLSVRELAELLQISETTIKREWTLAKAWLRREISSESNGHAAAS